MNQPRTWTREDLPPALVRALDLAIEKGARAPVILRATEVTGYTDWVLLLSGRSERNVAGITDGIRRGLTDEKVRPMGVDGLEGHLWDLLDYDDFMVHVFYHPVRQHYDLESMWRDAPHVQLDLPETVTDTSDLDRLETPADLPEYSGDLTFGGYVDEFEDDAEYEAGEADVIELSKRGRGA